VTDAVGVTVTRTGRRFDARAILELPNDVTSIWQTITDYEALPSFMPGLRSCRVLERERSAAGRERLVVEQTGEFKFLLFAQSMSVVLAIEHDCERVAEAKAMSFNLGVLSAIDVFEGRYELLPARGHGRDARVPLQYTAVIGLKLQPPPSIGSLAVKHNLEAQLKAVASEVARRSTLRSP
jgi:hypothetical protein